MSRSPIVVVGALGQREWTKAFLKAARASKYAPSTIAMALALIELHFNRKTGQCNPGHRTLAAELGYDTKTIQRAARQLEAGGWVRCHRPGQHGNVEFELKIPASPAWTSNVQSEGGPEWTKNGSRGDNCRPPFNEEHLNTGKPKPKSRQSRELMLAQIEARSRAANERRGRRS